MKRFTATALIMLAGLCASATLHAQTNQVRANIPFNFNVEGKQLPAGSYRFFTQGDGILVIQNVNRPTGAITHIADVSGVRHQDNNLIFHQYGDRYFLSEIHASSANVIGGELPRSRQERQAQQNQEASNQPQTIQLAIGN